jgi:hypothetical protein
MEPERRRQLVLAVLAVVLAIAIYRVWPRPAAPPTAASNARGAARPAAGAVVTAPDVKLEALQAERPKPHEGSTRNLFRFGAAPPPTERPQPEPSAPQAPPRPAIAPGRTVPPIPLKFIATMTVGGRLMAVLAEGSGREPVSGFEGDTVLGQYRIVRIGPESVELTYLDGSGRQTIRFSGS